MEATPEKSELDLANERAEEFEKANIFVPTQKYKTFSVIIMRRAPTFATLSRSQDLAKAEFAVT